VKHLNQLSNNFLIITQNGIYSFENPPLNYECKKIDGKKYRLVVEDYEHRTAKTRGTSLESSSRLVDKTLKGR